MSKQIKQYPNGLYPHRRASYRDDIPNEYIPAYSQPTQFEEPSGSAPTPQAWHPGMRWQQPSAMQSPHAYFNLSTVTDYSYLAKVVTQYRSLEAYGRDFHLYVLCTDDESFRVLKALNFKRCIPMTLSELNDSELFTLQSSRAANEFAWTLKSYLMLFLLEQRGLPHILYCDGDVCFTSNISRLYDDWGGTSIYLCRQRDVDWVEQKYGKFQAGIMGCRNDANGIAMLKWWKEKCREWCFNYEDNGRLGDQKYLDDVPSMFGSVKISSNRGINAAPWNTIYNNGYHIEARGNAVFIDGDPLVAYHFACLNMYDETRFDLWRLGRIEIQPTVRNAIYMPYLKALRSSLALLKAHGDTGPMMTNGSFDDAKTPFYFTRETLGLLPWDGKYAFCTISSRTYVAKTLALYSSIRRHLSNFHIWICCVDDVSYSVLSRFNLEHATLLSARNVETPEILATRATKSITEYCWTLKPALIEHVLLNNNVNRLLYCDSDVYFFSHPKPIHDVWKNYTTLLNLQMGTPELENKHGMYQAGMIGFSKTKDSLEILRWWKQKCTEWCYDDHSDPIRWGDQKYLQQVPDLFVNIRVNDRYGIVAAPWNVLMNAAYDMRIGRINGDVYVGNERLTAYHFGSINVINESLYDLWKFEHLNFDRRVLDHIYAPYLTQLRNIYAAIRARGFDVTPLFGEQQTSSNLFRLNALRENSYGNVTAM